MTPTNKTHLKDNRQTRSILLRSDVPEKRIDTAYYVEGCSL